MGTGNFIRTRAAQRLCRCVDRSGQHSCGHGWHAALGWAVRLDVAVMDWAAAGVWQKETYTGGNREAASEPTARGSEGGWVLTRTLFIFASLSLSHNRAVCELAHPRDPRFWGINPGRLPLWAGSCRAGVQAECPGSGRVRGSRSTLSRRSPLRPLGPSNPDKGRPRFLFSSSSSLQT